MRFTPTVVVLSLSVFIPAAFAQTVCGIPDAKGVLKDGISIRTASSKQCTAGKVLHFVNKDPSPTITSKKVPEEGDPPGEICDHLVELQMVKNALELKGGGCDQIKTLTPEARRAKLKPIIDLANDAKNLFFVSKNPENRKGDMVNAFLDSKTFVANKKDAQVVAANSYLTQTAAQSTAFAGEVDTLISSTFPGTTSPNVASTWRGFLAFAAQEATKSQATLNAPKKVKGAKTPANAACGTVKRQAGGKIARGAAACALPKKTTPKKTTPKKTTPKKTTPKKTTPKKTTPKKAATPKKVAAPKVKGRV